MSGVERLARWLEDQDMRHSTWEGQAETLLADPGPLLEALAEAGVLTRETSDPHAGHGCWQDPDEREGWQECGPATKETRYVAEWSPDARP